MKDYIASVWEGETQLYSVNCIFFPVKKLADLAAIITDSFLKAEDEEVKPK